jgi:hypothetical protein
MDTLTLTQTLLTEAACPVCARKAFDLKLRCEPGQPACHYLATCTGCGHTFDVERTEPEMAAGRPCERCPDGVREPVLRCHAVSGRCEVAWVCRQCEGTGAALLQV